MKRQIFYTNIHTQADDGVLQYGELLFFFAFHTDTENKLLKFLLKSVCMLVGCKTLHNFGNSWNC